MGGLHNTELELRLRVERLERKVEVLTWSFALFVTCVVAVTWLVST